MTRTHEQLAAMARFREAVASLGAVRVVPDAEGWPMIPGRGGAIEWGCDGVDCHACRAPGAFVLAAFTGRRRRHGPLLAIPGVLHHQRGDDELRAMFVPTPETLAAVAAIIRPRRRRTAGAIPAVLERAREAGPGRLAQSDFRGREGGPRLGPDHRPAGPLPPARGSRPPRREGRPAAPACIGPSRPGGGGAGGPPAAERGTGAGAPPARAGDPRGGRGGHERRRRHERRAHDGRRAADGRGHELRGPRAVRGTGERDAGAGPGPGRPGW
jgi:hypothetical protein